MSRRSVKWWWASAVACVTMLGSWVTLSEAQVAGGCSLAPKVVPNAKCFRADYTTATTDNLECIWRPEMNLCYPDKLSRNTCEGVWWTGIVNGRCLVTQSGSSANPMRNCTENAMQRAVTAYKYTAQCQRQVLSVVPCACGAEFADPPETMLIVACDCAN